MGGGDERTCVATNDDNDGELDYMDVGTVELLDEDFKDMISLHQLSNRTEDKLVFTVFSLNIVLTPFITGYFPNYFYLWHTMKCISLLSYRWYTYKRNRWHYFFFDFCYFTSFLSLIYIWSPWKIGSLFPVIFAFSNGPLLLAIIIWRNSLVPHSADKMTSLFIHVSPALTVWGIKWHATPEQQFRLCASPVGEGPHSCDHIGWMELTIWPLIYYLIWQIFYLIVVEVWRANKVKEQDYATSIKWIVEQSKTKKGLMYNLFFMFGPKYRKPMFILSQFMFTSISIIPTYYFFFHKIINVLVFLVVFGVACYNGASFYVDVIGNKYYKDKETKMKSS